MSSRHHRVPKSKGGKSNHENISVVSQSQHRAYHILFGDKPPDEVARILTEIWIDPSYSLVAVKKTQKVYLVAAE